jgi:hypothetical protein
MLKQFMDYVHPDLKLRMALYNKYLDKYSNVLNKHDVARYCSKYDFDNIKKEKNNG